MNAAALAFATAAVVGAATFFALVLPLRSFVSFLLAIYLLASAEVVLLTLALSPARWVGRAGYAVGEALLLAAAVGIWWISGRPRPIVPRLDVSAAARTHPILAALCVVVAVAFAYQLFVVLATPPNNGDSLTYHLTRAAAWLQRGGVHEIPAGGSSENEFPPNAEIEILFTLVWLRSDAAAALPQLLALAALVAAVYGCARRLGYSRPASLFPALLAATLSDIALQATTTQNDLVVATLVVAAAYFLRRDAPVELALAGLAIGLSLGTKFTAIFALPALALLAVVSSARARPLAVASMCAAIGFAACGSYVYVRNVTESGRPTGSLRGAPGENRPVVTAVGTISTFARFTYHFVDLSGLDVDHRRLLPVAGTARRTFRLLRIPTNPPESTGYPFSFTINQRANEDLSYFGPLGFLVVLPLAAAFPVLAIRRLASPAHAAHALSLPLYLVALAFSYRYSVHGRFLLTPVALVLPLAASIYLRRRLVAPVAAIGVAFLVLALAHNEMKPTGLRGTTPIWRMSRSEAQSQQWPGSLVLLIDTLERNVPTDAAVGTLTNELDPDYVLYGRQLQRRLVPLPRRGTIRAAECAGLRWIYVGRFFSVPKARGWRATEFFGAGALVSRDDDRPRPCRTPQA